jgi:hypothetical protein
MNPEASTVQAQARLVAALSRACGATPPIETHISYVVLTGPFAYKIKKAVDLGFANFTTLERRRFFCGRELELNRRLAPTLYLEVVPITGTLDRPQIGGDGAALEYAVKMRQFPQDALLSRVLARGELTGSHVDTLAAKVAAFHEAADRVTDLSSFGTPADVLDLALENFNQLEPLTEGTAGRTVLRRLRHSTMREHAVNTLRFADRRRDGFVRACHGDLHLGNIALVDGEVTVFDGIEFDERLRWTDVMADVAFVVMDLHDRHRPDLAARFLNAYLEYTGDYAGVRVLRFYMAYRAMVRAKIARMRESQTDDQSARSKLEEESLSYLTLAEACASPPHAGVIITHGPSGSGKTTLSQALLELVGAIRIRTDVERKRRHGLDPNVRTDAGLNAGLYAPGETERTYERVRDLAHEVVAGGYPAIADGTFLRHRHRKLFALLAAELRVPFAILDVTPPRDVLRRRIANRRRVGTDASEADEHVLELQLAAAEPLDRSERHAAFKCEPAMTLEEARQPATWKPLIDRLGLKSLAA